MAKYQYEAAVSYYSGSAEKQKRKMDELGADVYQKTLAVQEVEAELTLKKNEIAKMT